MDEEHGLKELNLKIGYSTKDDNLQNDFFNPCLNQSVIYDRISAYFSSRVFIFLLDGLKTFIQNGGKIRLVLGVIPKGEFDIINSPRNELLDYYLKNLESDIENFPKVSTDEHYKLLAWLIYNNRLEIKLAIINEDNNKNPQERKIIPSTGILHSKIGIFWDKNGNGVSYSGSPNCSLQAWVYNYENIKVFNSWEKVKSDYFELDKIEFENFWNERKTNFLIMHLPNENLRKIINKSQKSIEDINFEIITEFNEAVMKSQDLKDEDWIFEERSMFPKLIDSINLRYYQNEAINALKENEYCGILQMATGSGKTLTAIRATYELYLERLKEQKPLLVLIAVPDKYLVNQWYSQISSYTSRVIPVSSDYRNWKSKVSTILRGFKYKLKSYYFIITTNISLQNSIIDMLDSHNIETDDILIVIDEAHWLGQITAQEVFRNYKPKYRIGLTATPVRYFDEEGTVFLMDWFKSERSNESVNEKDSVVFKYKLQDAQNEGYLMKFKYHVIPFEITNTDYKKFQEITKTIQILKNKKTLNREDNKKRERGIFHGYLNRARILKMSVNKLEKLRELILELRDKGELHHIVVYCEEMERQMEQVIDLLYSDLNIKDYRLFVGDTPLEERLAIIQDIKTKRIKIILSMKCLRQGVDIPSLNRGILLSISGSELDWIQRVGRILRVTYSKPAFAEIYDFVAVTPKSYNMYQSIEDDPLYINQEKRISFFLDHCINKYQALDELEKLYEELKYIS